MTPCPRPYGSPIQSSSPRASTPVFPRLIGEKKGASFTTTTRNPSFVPGPGSSSQCLVWGCLKWSYFPSSTIAGERKSHTSPSATLCENATVWPICGREKESLSH
eukprot:Lithocolla_globosa_v1_NODE_2064_length_2185_cov_5.694836.p2 type:complete len:105 gc:universal NODE_2064_length_2185_cov_5.694836:841-1155(+)